ncbi:MAG: hypothetical protein ACKD6O_08090 [Candidatus Bathyarchaeota archaeon]
MARITSFTVFCFVFLIVYTLGCSFWLAYANGQYAFSNPYSGKVSYWEYSQYYVYSEVHNITFPSVTVYSVFEPDRRIEWVDVWFTDNDKFYLSRKDTWLGILWFQMSGSPITEQDVIDRFSTDKNYSKFTFDAGGTFQTDVYFYPLMASNGSFIYYPISESISHGALTVYMGVNATVPSSFNVGLLFTFLNPLLNTNLMPYIVEQFLTTVWWILMVLALMKLIIG